MRRRDFLKRAGCFVASAAVPAWVGLRRADHPTRDARLTASAPVVGVHAPDRSAQLHLGLLASKGLCAVRDSFTR